ncbi:helix-turn-helix transcriptional regulator [Pseudonocardia charpentierae]|uniref:LuxR C-terminal-related transcriptional regulator n=1 Tax=Pseudonocardia charpentierae TaxID=3075545 RepID=A0ABU2NG06_9PSEU|nr:LuxR C-terminal-related transcriptional regulator [Pseudonocardia sp. DSM 45834]MDT0352169.1 LuxR C-terminal-related transcriptional regulator [Pseudonocardia sp. DSM 45834]
MRVASSPSATVLSGSVGALLDVVDAAAPAAGGPRTLVLLGMPGIGKSTTLDALVKAVGERGVGVHRIAADEISRRQPFGLVSGLLGLEPVYPPRSDTADRVLDAVESLCVEGPLTLCADDVHHADADSLALLGRIASATRVLPLTLLIACRPLPVRDALTALLARPDVRVVEVVGLDEAGLAELVRARFAAPPGDELRSFLDSTHGNPFHADVLLDDLERRGRLAVVDGVVTVSGTTEDAPASVQAGARAHLALLDLAARDLLQVLAVWGRPATVEQLAAVTGANPVSLLGPVQAVVSSRVARWTDDEMLTFRHDVYRDVVYADLAPPLRRILHAACATQLHASGGMSTQILGHAGGAADRTEPRSALKVAATELAYAPAQAADLLADAAELAGNGPDADAIAVARAGALAAAGEIGAAESVARERLLLTRDAATRDELTRLRLHAIVSAADTADAIATIDERLAGVHDRAQREALIHLRRWVVVLGGREAIGISPVTGHGNGRRGASGAAALVPSVMDLFLTARCEEALALATEAVDAREAAGSSPWADGATAPIWPPWIALFARGPEAARVLSVAARREAQERGRGWLLPYHLFVAATIDHLSGRWDDAVAELDAGLEAATATGTGWLARPTGALLQIRTCRNELDVAERDLSRWKLRGLPEQFGLPQVGLAEILLGEAHGRASEAAEQARRSWSTTLDGGRLLWALLAGPDVARVALGAGDDELLNRVAADTARVPVGQVTALAPAADLVKAMARRDPDRAMAAATAFRNRGNFVGELAGWEEAAVAAAARGDQDVARTCAVRCRELASVLGAVGVERRIIARLRAHSVRLGVSGARRRPATGWQSLTPTELQVADLVGQGMTSRQIATRLFISPRTVQTHISHSLRKLDLTSRVELATTVARRQA